MDLLIWGLVFPTQLLVQLSGNEARLSTAGEVLTARIETRPLERRQRHCLPAGRSRGIRAGVANASSTITGVINEKSALNDEGPQASM